MMNLQVRYNIMNQDINLRDLMSREWISKD